MPVYMYRYTLYTYKLYRYTLYTVFVIPPPKTNHGNQIIRGFGNLRLVGLALC